MKTLLRIPLALVIPAVLIGCGDTGEMADDAPAMSETQMADTQTVVVADAGLQTPESVLHDPRADVYLVSNINGAPTAEDDNGFISRIAPDGEVAALKWIDGQAEDVTLNAPKGMAIIGDTLFVTDITRVRAFDRVSGESLGSREVPGATFLNDLAVGPDGVLYVSDSGLNPDFSPSGTDAVYRFEDGEPVVVAEGAALGGPNGLAFRGGDLVVVGFGGPQARVIPAATGEPEAMAELPGGQLDGVVVLEDGSLLVSSWATSSVYRIPADGTTAATPILEGIPSPADIGWDAGRHRVLVPVFNENRVEIHHVPGDG